MSIAATTYEIVHRARVADSADFGFDPNDLTPVQLVEYFDRRIAEVIETLESSELWGTVTDPNTNPEYLREIMKEVYLETVMYQAEIVECGVAIIAQMPRSLEVSHFDEMLHHQVEEFDHGEMMLRDFVGLGGDEQYARTRRMSPSAFGAAAMWRMLVHMRDPFAYLGALYPFEALTPIVSEMVKSVLTKKGFATNQTEFVEHHATADIEHARIIKELICTCVDEHPDTKASMCYGLEYFLSVYPMPLWNAAFRRAKRRHETR